MSGEWCPEDTVRACFQTRAADASGDDGKMSLCPHGHPHRSIIWRRLQKNSADGAPNLQILVPCRRPTCPDLGACKYLGNVSNEGKQQPESTKNRNHKSPR